MRIFTHVLIATAVAALLASRAWGKPDRVVLGYSASWADADFPAQCYNFNGLTHLARAFLVPRADGQVEPPEGFFNPALESAARAHGVKLLISLGGEARNADNWLSIARHPEFFQRFCTDLAKLLNQHEYDGFDIDWEPSATNAEDGAAFTSFLANLRARFPTQIITTALGTSDYWVGHFNWDRVVQNVDYVNVMAYDFSGSWGGRAAFSENLFPPGDYEPQRELSVAEGMRNLIENHHVPPGKLLLGMSFWGIRFSVDHLGDRFPANQKGWVADIPYAGAMCLLHDGNYAQLWDAKAVAGFLQRRGGGQVVVFETPESVRAKCRYAADLGCGGIMIWHVGADLFGDTAPLMDAAAEACAAGKPTGSRAILEAYVRSLERRVGDRDLNISGLPDDRLEALRRELELKWGKMIDRK
jgi:chitinase